MVQRVFAIIIKLKIRIITDVMVSLPAMISVSESDDIVQVCAVLSTIVSLREEFNITLTTRDGSGEEVNYVYGLLYIINIITSFRRFRLHHYIIYRSICIWVNLY